MSKPLYKVGQEVLWITGTLRGRVVKVTEVVSHHYDVQWEHKETEPLGDKIMVNISEDALSLPCPHCGQQLPDQISIE